MQPIDLIGHCDHEHSHSGDLWRLAFALLAENGGYEPK